jgi:hypothetical protein
VTRQVFSRIVDKLTMCRYYIDLSPRNRHLRRFLFRDLLATITRGHLPRDFDLEAELYDAEAVEAAKAYLANGGGWPDIDLTDLA